ncbi:hypothetical protein GCM10007061_03770 [Kocuria marina]|nr:hypothetical protein GCM10007061_03770 [Kocuria marina]
MLPDLTWLAWVGLLCGAFLVGFSKTAMPGINTLAVALFAATLPARASTGVLLVLLLVGTVSPCGATDDTRTGPLWSG